MFYHPCKPTPKITIWNGDKSHLMLTFFTKSKSVEIVLHLIFESITEAINPNIDTKKIQKNEGVDDYA